MRVILSLLACLLFTTVKSQSSEVFNTAEGALRGYDPVSYFTGENPLKGHDSLKFTWRGAEWHFASVQNLDSFRNHPENYAPQFGGYCAYGMAEGHKAPTDPNAWTISGGKLYLNYNTDVMSVWRKDQSAFISKAGKNWPSIKNKE